jgi:hypothetical protein
MNFNVPTIKEHFPFALLLQQIQVFGDQVVHFPLALLQSPSIRAGAQFFARTNPLVPLMFKNEGQDDITEWLYRHGRPPLP